MTLRIIGWAALLSLAIIGQARADSTDLENAYGQAAEHVRKHSDDFWLDGKPAGERALNRAWTLLADWTAAYLNEHPGATPKRLKHAFPDGDLDIVPLGPRTMLVSAQVAGAFGTIFIVDGSDGLYRPAWSIRGRSGREAFPPLDAWTAKAASTNCRDAAGDGNWARCGPVDGTVHRLQDDAQGRSRFYIEAYYAQAGGNAELDQLSFWTWTGTKAEPQYVTTFGTNDDDDPTNLDGGLLKVRVAENYRMISPWWDHLDRELDWMLQVGPDRIEDLGRRPLVPEVDAVDELLFRVAHRLPVDDLATPEVQTEVERIVAQARDDDARYGGNGEPSIAMAGDFTVRHEDGRSLVCLPTDEMGNLTFTLAGSFVSDLSVTPDDSGRGCPPGKP